MNYNEITNQLQNDESIAQLAVERVIRNLGLDTAPECDDNFNDLVHEMEIEIRNESI